jgi:alkanesulfonate monooxygenase SsuD/methylene tetrahydromethanopterin reductase-like flavin-dependent oxidoreductase (luciferase family)
MRLSVLMNPASWDQTLATASAAAAAGCQTFWVTDHLRDPEDPRPGVLDGWTVIAALSSAVRGIRLGVLVSNLIIRHPVLLAKQAVTVDRISDGRLELGIGGGIFASDHAMVGEAPWPRGERLSRLEEAVCVVTGLLGGESEYDGQFYRYEAATVSPGSIQVPRPPITIGANGSRGMAIAARHADGWNTYTDGSLSVSESAELIRARVRECDELCAAIDRQAPLHKSLLVFPAAAPWRTRTSVPELFEAYGPTGLDELVMFAPKDLGHFEGLSVRWT